VKTFKKTHRLFVGAVAIGTFVILAAAPATANASESAEGSGHSGYNAIPKDVPGNVPSLGFEAYSMTQLGDEVALGGNARTLKSMSVVMSSWGCESGYWNTKDCVTGHEASFDLPLTFTIYADNAGVPGAVLATGTKTVAVDYRPSASAECTGADAGKWYDKKDHTCYNGLAQSVKMDLDDVTLPDQVIWTVKYDTTHFGTKPIGELAACYKSAGGCGYDSLNIGVWSFPEAPFTGTDLNADALFWSTAMQTDWTGYRPLGAIVTQGHGDHQDD